MAEVCGFFVFARANFLRLILVKEMFVVWGVRPFEGGKGDRVTLIDRCNKFP